ARFELFRQLSKVSNCFLRRKTLLNTLLTACLRVAFSYLTRGVLSLLPTKTATANSVKRSFNLSRILSGHARQAPSSFIIDRNEIRKPESKAHREAERRFQTDVGCTS